MGRYGSSICILKAYMHVEHWSLYHADTLKDQTVWRHCVRLGTACCVDHELSTKTAKKKRTKKKRQSTSTYATRNWIGDWKAGDNEKLPSFSRRKQVPEFCVNGTVKWGFLRRLWKWRGLGGEHSPRSASRGSCREIQHTFRGHEPLKNCNFSNKRLVQDVSLRQMPRTMVNLALHNHATCHEYQNCFQILVITIRSDKATLGVNTSRSFESFS